MKDLTVPPIVLTATLSRSGMSDADIALALAQHTRVRRGVYAAEYPHGREEQHLLAARAVLATHRPDCVLSHVTAALVWEFPVMLSELGPVTVSRIGDLSVPNRRQPGVHVFGHILSSRDVIHHDGVPVTTAERTVLDCARHLPFLPSLAIADAAAHAGVLDPASISRQMSQMRGWKGVGKTRHVLAAIDPATESPGETWTRMALLTAGYEVESQFVVADSGGFVGRADFRIKDTPVLVEFDGQSKYGLSDDAPREALWREKRRHDALVQAGYEVVRLTWADLSTPSTAHRMIRDALLRVRIRGLPRPQN